MGGRRRDPVLVHRRSAHPDSTVDPTATTDTRHADQARPLPHAREPFLQHLFGTFPGVRGTDVGVALGKEQPLIRCPDWLPGDLPHDRAAALNHVNGGEMDGFGTGDYGATYAYSMFDEDQIPNYWLWAREYALSDNFFASANGPSYPNHFFFVAGTSGGAIDNAENIETRPLEDGTKFKSWGCDAHGDDVFVLVRDADGNTTKHDTCFTFPTVGEQLSGIGVDWAYYSAVPGQVGYFWNAYNGIANVFHTDLWQEHMRPIDRIIQDIEAERLPAVTWATPQFQLSDHPPFSTGHAHNWVSDIVNARDAQQHVGAHRDLPHVGRVGRLLRPDRAARARPRGSRDPGAAADDLALHASGRDRRPSSASSRRRCASSRTTGASPHLTDRIANTHAFEHVFDFSKGPREPVIGDRPAPAYGEDPFQWVGETFPDWEPGTDPVDKPL